MTVNINKLYSNNKIEIYYNLLSLVLSLVFIIIFNNIIYNLEINLNLRSKFNFYLIITIMISFIIEKIINKKILYISSIKFYRIQSYFTSIMAFIISILVTKKIDILFLLIIFFLTIILNHLNKKITNNTKNQINNYYCYNFSSQIITFNIVFLILFY